MEYGMNKILVPTDFSVLGGHALQYGIAMVNRIGGHLEIMHSFETPYSTGMLMSIFVVYKPQWVSTFDDRLYLNNQ